ncbi:alpha/beta hydrolase [Streptomyces sp. DG2A-72]|uniref:alpha/beta fold hydrolase n=1 Tax=Streptomyces sp. DG2A-72 TaxID=3051386 RepID=UPI00265C2701|nr:alpha/beta hydrolase [Streptomyces sp. DG2A-72]MDO0930419.1 alpha/beta hydrolase [Streptomyces sp. DG2A-72]
MEKQGLVSMTDEAQLRWMALGDTTRQPAVILLHGGPGLPDYLGVVALMIADLVPVYRYDQRGTGQSPWRGPHSFARHVDDLAELLGAWGVPKAVLIGHSYGTDLASRFCLRHPDRVASILLMCGPLVGDWRAGDRAERGRRMSAVQQERLRALEELPNRTEGRKSSCSRWPGSPTTPIPNAGGTGHPGRPAAPAGQLVHGRRTWQGRTRGSAR